MTQANETTPPAKQTVKPTKIVMALCDEMFNRRARYGKSWPHCWREKTREKLVAAGLMESKRKESNIGTVYYFTESGLAWYLELRPEHKRVVA